MASTSPMNIFSFEEFPNLSRESSPHPKMLKNVQEYPFLSGNSSSPPSSGSSALNSLSASPIQIKLKIEGKLKGEEHIEQMKQYYYWKEDPSIAEKKIKAGLDRFNRAYAAIPCNPAAAFSHAPVYRDGMAPYFTGFH